MKGMADALGDLGEVIPDRTLVLNILHGFNGKYMLVAGFALLVVAESLLSLREDDTRSWQFSGLFLTQTHTMPCQPEGLVIHIYRAASQPSICQDASLRC
jgi:hypothetical protein